MFDALGLRSFVKSSGSNGIHVQIPLNAPVGYAETKSFARQVAETLAERFPDLVLADISRARRWGKVLVDWGQNDRHIGEAKTIWWVAPTWPRSGPSGV